MQHGRNNFSIVRTHLCVINNINISYTKNIIDQRNIKICINVSQYGHLHFI